MGRKSLAWANTLNQRRDANGRAGPRATVTLDLEVESYKMTDTIMDATSEISSALDFGPIDLTPTEPLAKPACGHLNVNPACDVCHQPVTLPRPAVSVSTETQTDIQGIGPRHDFLWDVVAYMLTSRENRDSALFPPPYIPPIANSTGGSRTVGTTVPLCSQNDENVLPFTASSCQRPKSRSFASPFSRARHHLHP